MFLDMIETQTVLDYSLLIFLCLGESGRYGLSSDSADSIDLKFEDCTGTPQILADHTLA